MVHLIGFILVGNLVNQELLAKVSYKIAGSGYCDPENRIGEVERDHKEFYLPNEHQAVERADEAAGVERYDKWRDHEEALFGPAHQFGITAKLALYFAEQVRTIERREPHGNGVHKHHAVAGPREPDHQVVLGMRMMVPPVFTRKADY